MTPATAARLIVNQDRLLISSLRWDSMTDVHALHCCARLSPLSLPCAPAQLGLYSLGHRMSPTLSSVSLASMLSGWAMTRCSSRPSSTTRSISAADCWYRRTAFEYIAWALAREAGGVSAAMRIAALRYVSVDLSIL